MAHGRARGKFDFFQIPDGPAKSPAGKVGQLPEDVIVPVQAPLHHAPAQGIDGGQSLIFFSKVPACRDSYRIVISPLPSTKN